MADRFIPTFPGEKPTLGWVAGEWIESHLVVPSGVKSGRPVTLYDFQWEFLLKFFELKPNAIAFSGADAFTKTGSLYIDVQKKSKSAFMAMIIAFAALGDSVFTGWDEDGQPMSEPPGNPYIQVLGSNKDQAMNIYRPLQYMLENIEDVVDGLDSGATRIKLPKGQIDFTTSVANTRLGAPIDLFVATESQLFTESSGLADTARTLVRNVSGMNGRWISDTNAYSPIEQSWAQQIHESDDDDVLIVYKPPKNPDIVIDPKHHLFHKETVLEAIDYAYEGALVEKGGHVSRDRIFKEITRKATGRGRALRFFLNHITSLEEDVIDGVTWRSAAHGEPLPDGARVGLGFDGSVADDSTALVAFDVDTRTIHVIGLWEKPHGIKGDWAVPRQEVSAAIKAAHEKYSVGVVFVDPYYWGSYIDTWQSEYGTMVDYPTNQQKRFDEAITTFQTDLESGNLFHTDDPDLNRHLSNAVLKDGNLKTSNGPDGMPVHYKIIRKKKGHLKIDILISAILAVCAGNYAVEKELFDKKKVADPFVFELNI